MCATLGLRVWWVGTPFVSSREVAIFPPIFPNPFATFVLPFYNKRATPPALWRGVIETSPLPCQKSGVVRVEPFQLTAVSFLSRKTFNEIFLYSVRWRIRAMCVLQAVQSLEISF